MGCVEHSQAKQMQLRVLATCLTPSSQTLLRPMRIALSPPSTPHPRYLTPHLPPAGQRQRGEA